MVNFSNATSRDIYQVTFYPTAAVARGRFVDKDGNQNAVAGAMCFGMSTDFLNADDITLKKSLPVGVVGGYPMETGGAFNRGDKLASDNQGRPVAAIAGDYVNGLAEEDSSGAGKVARVWRALFKI